MTGISAYLSFRFRAQYPTVGVDHVTAVLLPNRYYSADQLLDIAQEVLAAEQRRVSSRAPDAPRPLPQLSPQQTYVLPSGAWRTVTSLADGLVSYYDEAHEDYMTTAEDFRRWLLRG